MINVIVTGPIVSLPGVAVPPLNSNARSEVVNVPTAVGVPVMMPVDVLSTNPVLVAGRPAGVAATKPGATFVTTYEPAGVSAPITVKRTGVIGVPTVPITGMFTRGGSPSRRT